MRFVSRFVSILCATGLFGLFGSASTQTIGQEIESNDRIIFLGDSITQAGARPGGYVSLFAAEIVEKFPDKKVEVIGAGISGNKVPDLQKRLQKHVLAKKPSLVFIYIGINDVWHSQKGKGTSKEDFDSGLRDIIKKIQDVGSKVILCTPSTIGEKTDGTNELDSMLEEYSAISRTVATETGSQLLDLRTAFIDHLKTANPKNQRKGILTRDGVHLNTAGNQFVAQQMLGAIGMGSATASSNVRHIVLFKFKDDAPKEKVDEIVAAFGDLKNQISEIAEYEAGTNVSPENLEQGFTHCFVVTFKTIADRDAYLPHPAHKKFVELIEGKIDKVLVFDFVNQ